MGTTSTPHLIAQASVPVAAPTPVPTQPPDPAATAFDWTGVILPASIGLLGVLVTTLVKYLDNRQIAKERQQHEEAMHRLRVEHEQHLDELSRQHELDKQRLQVGYERQLKTEGKQLDQRIEKLDSWNKLLHPNNFSIRFTEEPAYASLRPHLQPHVRDQVEEVIAQMKGDNYIRFIGSYYYAYDPFLEDSLHIRTQLLREVARIQEEWGLL